MSAPFHPTIESYDDIAAAVMETERGRWFLQEHARRNRAADTAVVLAAIAAAEARLARSATAGASDAHDLEILARRTSRLRATLAAVDQPGRLVTQAICQCDKLARAIKRARAGAHGTGATSERLEQAGAEVQSGAAEAAPEQTAKNLRDVATQPAAPDSPGRPQSLQIAASSPTMPAATRPHGAAPSARPQMPKAWTPGLLDEFSAEEAAVAPT